FRPGRHRRPNAAVAGEHAACTGRQRLHAGRRGEDHLFPGRYGAIPGDECGIRDILHRCATGTDHHRRPGASQRCAGGDRLHGHFRTEIIPMEQMNSNPAHRAWYEADNVHEVDSPALLVYPDRVKHNLHVAIGMVGDARRLRPHVKTHKSSAITKLQLAAGISRYKCATLAEAEMLGRCGAPDVVVAYPAFGRRLQAFLALQDQYPASRFSTIVDNQDAAEQLSEAAVSKGRIAEVYIDLDIGMGRTGVSMDVAERLYAHCRSLSGLRVLGLHAYDGQVREPDPEQLRRQCE